MLVIHKVQNLSAATTKMPLYSVDIFFFKEAWNFKWFTVMCDLKSKHDWNNNLGLTKAPET
jgi:hypothetical protein